MASEIYWPETLPDTYQQSGFGSVPQGMLLRTKMDSGLAKVRRKYTASWQDYTGVMVFSQDQLDTFVTFFTTDLVSGIHSFNVINPLNLDEYIEARFKIMSEESPYTIQPYSDISEWEISINLEADFDSSFSPDTLIADTGEIFVTDDSFVLIAKT